MNERQLNRRVGAGAAPTAPTINDTLFVLMRRAFGPLGAAPWWLKVTLVYLGARLVSFLILSVAAFHEDASPWGGQRPDYLTFINRWDVGWYERIFNGGYPSTIPRNPDGSAQPNAWAFYPLFPLIVKGASAATTLPWVIMAPIIATAAGLAATLMVYVLFTRFAAESTALWGTIFFATFPISAILQIGYAESLTVFLLAAALYLLSERRYWWAIPVVIALDLSRPVGAPFAAVVGLHLLLRWWNRQRDPFPPKDAVAGAALLIVSAMMAFAWPLIASWVTGERSAYTDTETSWRGEPLVLFKPWFDAGVNLVGPLLGPLLPLLLVVLAALYLNSRAVRRIGSDLQLWCGVYLLYLLAVLDPQSSTFRMMLPLFPLALPLALLSSNRAFRGTVLVLFTTLQIVWVTWLWQLSAISTGTAWPP